MEKIREENKERYWRENQGDILDLLPRLFYSLKPPGKMMGETSFSLSFASDHHQFYFIFLCWLGFANCTSKDKSRANYGPREIKIGLGF
jgi:hypothetical protein